MSIGVYIHIPYCKSKCHYCDFLSSSNFSSLGAYLDKLKEEIGYYSDTLSDTVIDTVFIGGGTPSALPRGALRGLFDTLSKRFKVKGGAEITVEANPDTIDVEKVEEYKQFCTRVSLGVQSLDNKVLKYAGRLHDETVARNALKLLSKTNLNVSADLILGLPLDSVEGVNRSTKKILDYGIGHLSAYGLKVEDGTKFHRDFKSGVTTFPDDDMVTDMYDTVVKVAKDYGLMRYEVSNFAKIGEECRHNVGYWKRLPYLGLGIGAHSLIDDVRYENPREMNSYLDAHDFDKFRKIESTLTKEDSLFEEIMLRLRLSEGIDVEEINVRYGIDFFERFKEPICKLNKVLECNSKKIRVKEEYFYALNSIIVEFLE